MANQYKINVYGEISAKTKENLDSFFLKFAMEIYANRNKFEKIVRGTFKLQREAVGA